MALLDISVIAVLTLCFSNRGLTAVLAIHKASNLRKQGTIDIDVDLSVAVEEQTKVTKTDEAGKEWGGEIGGTVGYEVSGTFGIPQIISSSSKGKVDITGKWVGKNVVKHADSAEDSKLVRVCLSTYLSNRKNIQANKCIDNIEI